MTSIEPRFRRPDKEMVPRILVQGMFTLMAATLTMVTFAVVTGRPHVGVPVESPVQAETLLRLDGVRGGPTTAFNASGQAVAYSETNKSGFIGVIWLVLARERMMHDAPGDAPVRVVRRENGHIAIYDTVTDWSVELAGYGQDNVAAFARLID